MHKLKVIQVNIYKGKYLDALIEFLKKEDADFVTMQEVTAGAMGNHQDKKAVLFEIIRDSLGMHGVFHNDVRLASDLESLHGNAVLSKYPIVESDQIILKEFRPFTDKEFNNPEFFPDFPRSIVDASVDFNGKLLHVLSVHGAWTAPPTDTPDALRQAELIAKHLKSLKSPFLLGGDMNTTSDMQVIKIIETAAVNLLQGSGITYTTHPTMHKIAPRKLAVDYIFASKEFKKISIEAPEVLVSDHLPVVAELEM